MKSKKQYAPFHFLSYAQAAHSKPPSGTLWFDISKNSEPPLNQLSPFYPHEKIPVPGMPGKFSDSVEGIWQGLKVIRGEIAPRFFKGPGKKRGGKPSGHRFGTQKRLLNLVEARQRIYIVAYFWVLENRIEPELIEAFLSRAYQKIPQYFYDRENNGSLFKDLPLAHAALFVQYLNQQIQS